MAIYLIRHGETHANATRVLQTPDVPLSDIGQQQARRLGERLAQVGIASILASDMRRAAMTAEALQHATRAPLAFDRGLHERNFGDLRGTPYAELDEDPFGPDYEPPGGESWDVFHDRVAEVWQRVARAAEQTEGHLAVVTHGLVCRAVVAHHAECDAPDVPGWGNTSLTILDGPDPWRVSLLACTAHLDEEASSGVA